MDVPITLVAGWIVSLVILFLGILLAVQRKTNDEAIDRLEKRATDHGTRIHNLELSFAKLEVKQDQTLSVIQEVKSIVAALREARA